MKKKMITVCLVFSASVCFSVSALSDTKCSLPPQILNCGGVQINDMGCSISCPPNVGYDSLCFPSECHVLPQGYICGNKSTNCLLGHDNQVYVINYSYCFCD